MNFSGSEREMGDRDSLSLPGRQMDLLELAALHGKSVYKVCKTILVILDF